MVQSGKKKTKIKISIRLATLDDFDNLSYVYDHDVVKHSQPFSKYPLSEWLNQPNIILSVAETEKKKLVGFMLVRLAGQVARIDKYCVTKNYSNKDIAKQILESMLPVCKGYTFSIYIPKKKLGLLKQFKSLGFKVIDEIPQLFGKGHHGLNLQKHMKITKKVKPRAKKLVPVIEPEPEKIHLPEEAENRDMDSVYDPRNYINF